MVIPEGGDDGDADEEQDEWDEEQKQRRVRQAATASAEGVLPAGRRSATTAVRRGRSLRYS